MNQMPYNRALMERTKALAALDLIMSPEWEGRYFSFNCAWSPSEQMASMRDGCGNEWWIVFHRDGWAALKGLGKESPAWNEGGVQLSMELQRSFPAELAEFAREPAFRWDATSFAGYRLSHDSPWIWSRPLTSLAGLDGGEAELLSLLSGTARDYADFAADYYEADIPVEVVQQVFDLCPVSPAMISRLNPDTEFSDIEKELYFEIGYPRADIDQSHMPEEQ